LLDCWRFDWSLIARLRNLLLLLIVNSKLNFDCFFFRMSLIQSLIESSFCCFRAGLLIVSLDFFSKKRCLDSWLVSFAVIRLSQSFNRVSSVLDSRIIRCSTAFRH
jgi:hypothetical protein